MSRVVHFEIAATRPEDLVRFCTDVFGWTIQNWAGPIEYWLVTTGPGTEPGIDGAIRRRSEGTPGTVNTISVSSVDASAEKVLRSGGRVVAPKMAVPGVGYMAYCADPEGNLFGIMEEDPSAT